LPGDYADLRRMHRAAPVSPLAARTSIALAAGQPITLSMRALWIGPPSARSVNHPPHLSAAKAVGAVASGRANPCRIGDEPLAHPWLPALCVANSPCTSLDRSGREPGRDRQRKPAASDSTDAALNAQSLKCPKNPGKTAAIDCM